MKTHTHRKADYYTDLSDRLDIIFLQSLEPVKEHLTKLGYRLNIRADKSIKDFIYDINIIKDNVIEYHTNINIDIESKIISNNGNITEYKDIIDMKTILFNTEELRKKFQIESGDIYE